MHGLPPSSRDSLSPDSKLLARVQLRQTSQRRGRSDLIGAGLPCAPAGDGASSPKAAARAPAGLGLFRYTHLKKRQNGGARGPRRETQIEWEQERVRRVLRQGELRVAGWQLRVERVAHHLPPSRVARTAAEPRRARGRLAADDAAHGGAGPAGGAGFGHGQGTSSRRPPRATPEALRRASPSGVDEGNFDGRTCLHLAASNGRLDVVACLVDELGAATNVVDRWGGTPLDDAVRHSHAEVKEFLEGARRGVRGVSQPGEWDEGADLCDAAVKGDTSRLRRLAAQKSKRAATRRTTTGAARLHPRPVPAARRQIAG